LLRSTLKQAEQERRAAISFRAPRYHEKMPPRFTDQCRILDVAALYRCGFLKPGHTGAWEWESVAGLPPFAVAVIAERGLVTLRYFLDATGEEIAQRVPVEVRPCKPTAGQQWWWHCPACGKRTSKLFGSADRLFRCRECQMLGHRSRKEQQPWQRLLRFAQ
jgi:hypothetical protein